jgi:hypothetical protein
MSSSNRIRILYKNHRGEISWRNLLVIVIYSGECLWHKGRQVLLEAIDIDKGDTRTFAVKDIIKWDDWTQEKHSIQYTGEVENDGSSIGGKAEEVNPCNGTGLQVL